jgi:hypothetical protein
MKAPKPGSRDASPSVGKRLARMMVAYVCVGALFAGVIYWINPDHVWSAIAPIVGGLIGLLILSTPPVRRRLGRLRRSQ